MEVRAELRSEIRERPASVHGEKEAEDREAVTLLLTDSMFRNKHGVDVERELEREGNGRVVVLVKGGCKLSRVKAVDTTWNIRAELHTRGIEQNQVEKVILAVGTNDIADGLQDGEGWRRITDSMCAALKRAKIDVQEMFGPEVQMGWIPVVHRARRANRRAGGTLLRLDVNEQVTKRIVERGWRVARVDERAWSDDELTEDGLHPARKGLQLLVGLVGQLMQR